jgi:hypothetical protein
MWIFILVWRPLPGVMGQGLRAWQKIVSKVFSSSSKGTSSPLGYHDAPHDGIDESVASWASTYVNLVLCRARKLAAGGDHIYPWNFIYSTFILLSFC